ncbi:flagellar hook-basal body complex protein FliE [Eubacteriales bacterium OttesenSCG-928-M02]|nr:flagellar hook-basal body complex protein FliE [Eubacteriales bacterium OttesenSCG-928-M02]
MRIDPISNLFPNAGLDAKQVKPVESEGNKSFSGFLSDAIGNAVQTDVDNQEDTLALLSATDGEIHDSMIETTKAELALNLAIQIRNKVVDAYNEVMRMQV